jgi:hypothetical protein
MYDKLEQRAKRCHCKFENVCAVITGIYSIFLKIILKWKTISAKE